MRIFRFSSTFIIFLTIVACTPEESSRDKGTSEWRSYNGSPSSNKYSKLSQINKENVESLEVAWSYDMRPTETHGQVKCNPLMVNGVLYGTTASRNMVALDALTGQEKWYLDLKEYDSIGNQSSARGLMYWEKESDSRIFYVYSEFLYAVDAKTGKIVDSFGENGRIRYSTGLGDQEIKGVRATSPGIVYKDLIIAGSTVSEFLPAAPGHIRAFNAITGELEWVFRTIPEPGDFGYDTWPENAYKYIGGANSWSGLSLDVERGIVYVPTGSATYDFYGANRTGQNLFSNCLLALNAETGERIWHYQFVHHDLWDRDLSCPPNLTTVVHDGQEIDAVAQPTKQGYVYLFNRITGEPLFEIKEVPVPQSSMTDEVTWPTQPLPVKPPPFTRQELTEDLATDISPEANAYVRKELKKYQTKIFTPPNTEGVIVQPFYNGGANWGGGAIDEETGTLIINVNDVPWLLKLIDLEAELASNDLNGFQLYQTYCATCHGPSREGGHYIPSLIGIEEKLSHSNIVGYIENGRGLMPAMSYVTAEEKSAIAAYLLGLDDIQKNSVEKTESWESEKETTLDSTENLKNLTKRLKYTNRGYITFTDEEGYPAIKPPWGTLNAVDLNKGEILWQIPLGEYEELTKKGIPPTGTINQGGPVVTAGGLIFIAATKDAKFRAFDKDSGELLWEYQLPGPGLATPTTYEIDGEQYVVIAVTGNKNSGFLGKYMAFKLPD